MKKQGRNCFMMVMVFLLTLSVAAQAEVYVESFLGGTTAANLGSASFQLNELSPVGSTRFSVNNGSAQPSLIGGGRLGTWFVPGGFLGFNYPNWMKYFGFYTDVSYQALNVNGVSIQPNSSNLGSSSAGEFSTSGFVVTWAFMFAGRYGFLPNQEVPFGRLQPWVGIGPAILFTAIWPKNTVNVPINLGGPSGIDSLSWNKNINGAFAVTPGLVVDAGVRYMIVKKFSISLSFRYRYARPNFHWDFENGGTARLNFSPTYNLFSGMAGIAYHF
jgi:outer membrane protein W